MTITLTGQSMIRGDTRADAPEAVATIRSLIEGELAVTNFEAAIYDPAKGQTVRDGRFASPSGAMEALKSFGFNLLALGNNHSYDLKADGIVATLEAAERLEIAHAGTGRDAHAANETVLLPTPCGSVAFLAHAAGLIHAGRATPAQPGVNELAIDGETPNPQDAQRILQRVRAARQAAQLVIVSVHNHHYPGVEKPADFKQLLLSELPERLAPPPWLEGWGRALVDAGADVVAMHGPPFLHGIEVYQGKPIFYSLGNFIFQVPPESIHLEEPIMWESVVAHVDFDGSRLKQVRLQPVAMNKVGKGLPNPHDEYDVNEYHRTRGLPKPATAKQARFLLERLARLSAPYGTELILEDGTARLVLDRA